MNIKRNPGSSAKAKAVREKFLQDFASHDGITIASEDIKHFTFLSLPNDLSPPDTIHIEVTLGVPTRDTAESFGWAQLSLLDWLEYACSQARRPSINEDSGQDLGYRILRVLVQFALVEDMTPEQWDRAAELMKDLKCIPTNMGLKLPTDSYFDEADISGALPVDSENFFLDIPETVVAVERGFEYRPVTPEHIRDVLARIRGRRMSEGEDADLLEVRVDLSLSLSELASKTVQDGFATQYACSSVQL